MDEHKTDEGGTKPPEDMPTQAFPPAEPAMPANDTPAPDAPAMPPITDAAPPPPAWQPAETTVTSVPVANWQQPTTSAPPPVVVDPTPPPAPTWQQAAPPAVAAAAATPWQPPQSQWVQPAPVAVQPGGTTALAKVGSIILILFGLLTTLGGLVIAVAFNTLRDGIETQFPQLPGVFVDAAVTFGIVVLVIGIVEVLAGIFSWRGSGWARVVGIIYGVLLGLLFVAGLFGPRSDVSDVNTGNGLAVTAVIAIAYLYTAIVFLFRFRSSRTT